jgi:hypothetical protein
MGVPEVKERHDWCPHADPGKGCKIYEDRPAPCRTFSCRWLLDETLPAHWFPRTARIVIDLADNPMTMLFIVDPAYPRRWYQEPYFTEIKKLAKAGKTKRGWASVVLVGDMRIPII